MKTYAKVGVSLCVILIVTIVTMGMIAVYWWMPYIKTEIVLDIESINPNGARGSVFVAYRPGISSYQKDMTDAFIEGLVENDWSVDVTTTSTQTPTDVSKYDLLVFGSPTYGGLPHNSTLEYIKSLGDLNKKEVVLISTSGGSDTALTILEDAVTQVNGVVIKALSLHVVDQGARETSYQAGKSIS